MACACAKKRNRDKFVWSPPEGSDLKSVTYNSEIEAKAKVLRKGGSYEIAPSGG